VSNFEAMVLFAVIRVGEEAYGVPVCRELERVTGRTVAVAAVYAALQRLEGRGLVSSRTGDPTPIRGGRAKRVFHVSTSGLAAARETARAFTALWSGLPRLEPKGGS
jgi:DNA-binding PadR family transcriptional regulator